MTVSRADVRSTAADRPRKAGGPVRPDGSARPVFLLALAVLATISPFATDMYLPAFTQITGEFEVTASAVQLTLTSFLVGVAAGQLVFGPLSDRFGRKPPLLVGTVACVAASAVAALAPSIEVLVGARLVQGFAGAAGIVIGRAIVADLFQGAEAARIFSLLAVLGGIGPIAAPLFGGFLAGPIGWRGVMGVLCALTVGMLLLAVFVVKEPPRGDGPTGAPRVKGLGVLRNRQFTSHGLIKMFGYMMLMGYIAASPFIFQNMIGVGAIGSGLLFALNSVGLIAGNSLNARLVRRFGPRRMLFCGLWVLTAAAALLGVLVAAALPAYLLPVPLVLLVGSMGLIFGNAVALAMQHTRGAAGTGSALIGFSQFIGGAAVAPLVGLAGESSAVPLAAVVLAGCAATWVCFLLGRPAAG